MDVIEKYLREHSDGKDYPVCSSELAKAFGVPRTTIRRMINTARSNGSPICSGQKGSMATEYCSEIDKAERRELPCNRLQLPPFPGFLREVFF